jgi:hypothetical protein
VFRLIKYILKRVTRVMSGADSAGQGGRLDPGEPGQPQDQRQGGSGRRCCCCFGELPPRGCCKFNFPIQTCCFPGLRPGAMYCDGLPCLPLLPWQTPPVKSGPMKALASTNKGGAGAQGSGGSQTPQAGFGGMGGMSSGPGMLGQAGQTWMGGMGGMGMGGQMGGMGMMQGGGGLGMGVMSSMGMGMQSGMGPGMGGQMGTHMGGMGIGPQQGFAGAGGLGGQGNMMGMGGGMYGQGYGGRGTPSTNPFMS